MTMMRREIGFLLVASAILLTIIVRADAACTDALVTGCVQPIAQFTDANTNADTFATLCGALDGVKSCLKNATCTDDTSSISLLWKGKLDAYTYICGEGKTAFSPACFTDIFKNGLASCNQSFYTEIQPTQDYICQALNNVLRCDRDAAALCLTDFQTAYTRYDFKRIQPSFASKCGNKLVSAEKECNNSNVDTCMYSLTPLIDTTDRTDNYMTSLCGQVPTAKTCMNAAGCNDDIGSDASLIAKGRLEAFEYICADGKKAILAGNTCFNSKSVSDSVNGCINKYKTDLGANQRNLCVLTNNLGRCTKDAISSCGNDFVNAYMMYDYKSKQYLMRYYDCELDKSSARSISSSSLLLFMSMLLSSAMLLIGRKF